MKLDREKLGEYAELYKKLGGYPYDRDPGRPALSTRGCRTSTGPTRR